MPGLIALAFAAAFAGAAAYVNWVEQPARLALDDEALLSEWGPSDSRGVALLAGLRARRRCRGFIAYFEIGGRALGVRRADRHCDLALCVLRHGAAQQPDPVAARRDVAAARALVRQWGLIESGFAAIGVLAVAMFLWAL